MQLSEEQLVERALDELAGNPIGTRNIVETSVRVVLNALAEHNRAQADARPVAEQWKTWVHEWMGEHDVILPTQAYTELLGTHPEASAPGLSDEELFDIAVESGLVTLDAGVKEYRKYAEAILTRASAATVAEPSDKAFKVVTWNSATDREFATRDEALKYIRTNAPNDWHIEPSQAAQQQAEPMASDLYEALTVAITALRNIHQHTYADRINAMLAAYRSEQAEPGADERAAFEAWQAMELPSHQRSSYTAADVEFNCYEAALAAWLEQAKRANSQENSAPLHLGACITDGKLYVTAMQSGPSHTTTVVATAELDMDALSKGDCHTVMIAAQSGQRAGDTPVWYVRQVHQDHFPEFNKVDEFSDGQGGGEALYRKPQGGQRAGVAELQTSLGEMVNRFLCWRLPADFQPDAGIHFKPVNHPNAWPTGTNLFTADQAKAMLAYVLGIEEMTSNHIQRSIAPSEFVKAKNRVIQFADEESLTGQNFRKVAMYAFELGMRTAAPTQQQEGGK